MGFYVASLQLILGRYVRFLIFLLRFGCFGSLYQRGAIQCKIHSGKYFPELESLGTSLTTNPQYLDHLSVK